MSLSLFLLGTALLSQSFYMEAKAQLAQILIAYSWQVGKDQDKDESPPPKPWWWADTRATIRLEVPRLQRTVFVMQDDSSESLAFGPGHLPSSAALDEDGHVMIAGHRDSHFAFLQNLQVGDELRAEDYRAHEKRYRVTDMRVIDSQQESLELLNDDLLTLITCYPFDDLVPGGPLRMLVIARAF
ncbi:MAG: class GN sortase [Gammaproteobacteria bacterium]|nr:class GN sortase [Gammaproteobacteria bacterium]